MAPTTLRSIRVDDDLWKAATEIAQTEGRTVSEVVRELLALWVVKQQRKAAKREN